MSDRDPTPPKLRLDAEEITPLNAEHLSVGELEEAAGGLDLPDCPNFSPTDSRS